MCDIAAGDLVRVHDAHHEMLVIGRADDRLWEPDSKVAFFCVWEQVNLLHEEVFTAERLVIVRKERRCALRGGELSFPGSRDA